VQTSCLKAFLVLGILIVAVAASGQTVSGPVTYSYDELGRLIGAVASTGEAVRYNYDSVGNILSITRYAAGQSTIFEFHPKSGPVGTAVSISGSSFSANPAQDTVSFNGTPAVITSASATSLTVLVPSGSTTGTITVTSPSGSVTGSDSFTVTADNGNTRIDSFTPQIVAAGTTLTIAGANFDTTLVNDRLSINSTHGLTPTAATSSSLSLSTPSSTGSGHISLSTPNGAVTTTSDLFVPPPIYGVSQVGFTGRTLVSSPGTVSLAAANQIGILLFEGQRGQMVSAVASSGSTFSNCTFYIYTPTNAALLDSRSTNGTGQASGFCGTSGGFLDSQVLPTTGTYALTVVPGTATGHVSLTPYVFNDIQGGQVALSSTANTTIGIPGQNANFTFAGITNQHVSISIPSNTFNSCSFEIVKPDGTFLVNVGAFCSKTSTFYDVPILPQTGNYKLVVDPGGTDTGSITFKLNDATDVTGTITADGTPVSFATTVPGQKAKFTFSGTAGQIVSAVLDNNTYVHGIGMTIFASDGSTVAAAVPFIDQTSLPATGTYQVVFAPLNGGTGQARVRLYTVPGNFTASGTLGGTAIPVTIGTPGQNGRITFPGTQGQRASIAFSAAQFSGLYSSGFTFEILRPDGSLFAGPSNGGPFHFGLSTTSGFIDYNDVFVFPATGTYTVVFDPDSDATGSMSVNLYDATDLSLNINADGSVNGTSTSSPGQNTHANFTPTIGQKISAVISTSTYAHLPSATLRRIDSGGSVFNVQSAGTDGSNLFLETLTVAQSGQYFLFVDPTGQDVGSANVALYTVNDINTTVDTSNDPVTVTTTVPGQNANVTFSATAGQSLTLSVSGSSFPLNLCNVQLNTPSGSNLIFRDCTGGVPWTNTRTASQTGTYTIVIDPVRSSTGSLTLSVSAQ
jgi:YD repeat-containing protein